MLDIEELSEVSRYGDERGKIYYIFSGALYDHTGILIKTKIETYLQGGSKNTKEGYNGLKLTRLSQNTVKMSGNSEFFENVHEFTSAIMDTLLENFNGKIIGQDGATKGDLMKVLFGDYNPGEKISHKKSKKSKDKSDEKPKKKRPLNGYTYFGKMMKEEINKQLESMDPKPRYTEGQSILWKKLSDEEKGEWTAKAKQFTENSVA